MNDFVLTGKHWDAKTLIEELDLVVSWAIVECVGDV